MINRFIQVRDEPYRWLVAHVLHTDSIDPLLGCFWNGEQKIFKISDVVRIENDVLQTYCN